MTNKIQTLLISFICLTTALFASTSQLEREFRNPPDSSKPWSYWYWLESDVTRDGITKDLEHMAKIGISKAMIGNINGVSKERKRKGRYKVLSSEWRALTRHAMKEAHRLGIELYMFNSPGWSQSGGPWNTYETSMRRVGWREYPHAGGKVSMNVRPAKIPASQDIAVLALRKRKGARAILGSKPKGKAGNVLVFKRDKPFTARALEIEATDFKGALYAIRNGRREKVVDVLIERGNKKTDFLPDAPQFFSFSDVTASHFELSGKLKGKATLTSEPRIPQHDWKQLGRMHPTPSPSWSSYQFRGAVEPGDPSVLPRKDDILDLSKQLAADGTLTCLLPEGKWTIIYFGMVPTGKENHPAAPEATGLECDKMSRSAVAHHFNGMFSALLKEMTLDERSAFTGLTVDSYEVGSQNWTDDFAAAFEKRNGYNPIHFLPVMTGRMVDSARASDKFLWDLRRTVADMIAENYVGGLREIAHKHDMVLWLENYGHWGFPGEFLIYGGQADEVSGEFWSTGTLGHIECRAASSCAHIYGKRRAFAEAFTSKLDLKHRPRDIKLRGESMFCEGVNHFVLHVYANQTDDKLPGKNPWFGTAFHRNNPWMRESRDWIRYLQRCHLMLQEGEPVADVAVYIGDFAPQMTGPANPVPNGYDYDYMGSDAILRKLHVVDGEWVVYDENDPKRIAARYKWLAMPPALKVIRPRVRQRLDELEKAGGKVIATVPVPRKTLEGAGIRPLVADASCSLRFKARRLPDGMIFFLTGFEHTGLFSATLRVTGKTPVLCNPATGEITELAHYVQEPNGTKVFLKVTDERDSFFLLFQDDPAGPSVIKNPGNLDLYRDDKGQLVAESSESGTFTLTLSDNTTRTLTFPQAPEPVPIRGPWKTISQKSRYSAVKETTVNVPEGFSRHARLVLHLGQVANMAKVVVNGTAYETLWVPPFVQDVTEELKPGKNNIQVVLTTAIGRENMLTIGEASLHAVPRIYVEGKQP